MAGRSAGLRVAAVVAAVVLVFALYSNRQQQALRRCSLAFFGQPGWRGGAAAGGAAAGGAAAAGPPPLGPEDCALAAEIDIRFTDPRLADLVHFINGSQAVLGGLCANCYFEYETAITAFRQAGDLGPLATRCLLRDARRGCLRRSQVLRSWWTTRQNSPILVPDTLLDGSSPPWEVAPQGFYFAAGAAGSAPSLEVSLAFPRERPMPLRSMSKALTAAVMLALQDRGLLSIDDPVAKHLPAFGAPPPGASPATLRNVLTHTAGLPAYGVVNAAHGPPALARADLSLADAAADIAGQWGTKLCASPYVYTGLAYQLLGAVAESAAGKSWHALFAELVAQPLGMRNTRFYNFFSADEGVPNPHLAAGVVGTPGDMELFARMLLRGGVGAGGARVLSAAAVHDMLQPHPNTTCPSYLGKYVRAQGMGLARAGKMHSRDVKAAVAFGENCAYGLGLFVSNADAPARRAMLIGRFDVQIVLEGVEGAAPHYAHGYSFGMFRGSWSVPAALYLRAMTAPPA